jgi:AraC family L-rhamnose operon transcriptional activator RhaR
MSWIATLNSSPRRLPLSGHIDVLSWNYDAALLNNVPHRHTHFEVCLVGDYGRGEYRVQNTAHVIKRGDVFIARPGVVHQIVNTQPELMELYWISFRLDKCFARRRTSRPAAKLCQFFMPGRG